MTAAENREFARALLRSEKPSNVELRWCEISAFYAAVHYVNAFLWERRQIEPSSHEERTVLVSSVRELRLVSTSYSLLLSAGLDARYRPRYRTHQRRVGTRVDEHLEAIRVAVLNALQSNDAVS